MVHHGFVNVCIKHRWVSHYNSCPTCGSIDLVMNARWRAPRKTNDRAWKRLANGEKYWDRKARAKSRRVQIDERIADYWFWRKHRSKK